jgi:hypothetical protein
MQNCTFSVYVYKPDSMLDYLFHSRFNYEKNSNKFYLIDKKDNLANFIKDGLYVELYFELDLVVKNMNKEQLVGNRQLIKTLFFYLQELIGLKPKRGKLFNLKIPSMEYRNHDDEKNISINLRYYENKNYFMFNVLKRVKITRFF